ncbi:MAG: hypothetical protein V3R99_00635 [Thermoguttaceae bacterium]
MTTQLQQSAEFRCPGEPYPISRAVHLGRMARFYPGCRQCPYRDDTGTLSTRQVEQLAETRSRGPATSLLHDEGAAGVYLNDLTPAIAREMAAALGISLQRHAASEDAPTDEIATQSAPVVVLGGDGRPLTGPMVAAVGEGLRFAGCNVVDVGPTTSPCAAFAIDHLGASGGVLVGNSGNATHTVGLKFWADGPHPISAGKRLDAIRQAYEAGVDRPTRVYGSLRRFQADGPYLATLRETYHGLRPLRVVLSTSSGPAAGFLDKLTEQLACRILPGRTNRERLGDQVRADQAHLAAVIDDDGETCRVLDEAGRPVAPERLLLLVARHSSQSVPGAILVLEDGADGPCVEALRALGLHTVHGGPTRADMQRTIRRHDALLGGGRSGRFWHTHTGIPLPDGLTTLSLLLVILSQSDRRLSEVLDRQAKVG